MTTIQQINDLAKRHPDGQVLFDEPINVRSAPHQPVFAVFGVWVGSEGLFVLDGAGEWHGPLLPEQQNGDLMINSIYQRMKMLELNGSAIAS
jgi:hypothetical protein